MPLYLARFTAFLLLFINVFAAVFRMESPCPNNPWESGIIVDAWRAANNTAVYTPAEWDHATHMYGPVITYLLGAIFKCTGANLYAGRAISLVAGLGAMALLIRTFLPHSQKGLLILAAAILIGINSRTANYLVETRPDMLALWFAVLAVLLFYLGWNRGIKGLYFFGVLSMIAAFFTKQPYACCSLIPLVPILLDKSNRPRIERWGYAIFPLAVFATFLLWLHLKCPLLSHYMLSVPASVRITLPQLCWRSIQLLGSSLLFYLFFADWLRDSKGLKNPSPQSIWILAAVVVTLPVSILTAAKSGGAENSFFPACIAMGVFCIHRFSRLHPSQLALSKSKSFLLDASLAISLCIWAVPHPKHTLIWTTRAHGDQFYLKVVEVVRNLPGHVVCPEDPTIPLQAKGFMGRAMFLEFDNHIVGGEWDSQPPPYTIPEINQSDYVIQVYSPFSLLVSSELLQRLNFEPLDNPSTRSSRYRLWKKIAPPEAGVRRRDSAVQ